MRAYRIKHIHIPVEHPHALTELQICVRLGGVHVENVVKSVIVELAEHGICARVGSMFPLHTSELLAMVSHSNIQRCAQQACYPVHVLDLEAEKWIRKPASPSNVPDEVGVVRRKKSNGRFRRITYENPLWIITMESSERITPKPISLNPVYLKARVRSHLSALTGV